MSRVLVLGCGPAGLMAAHAAAIEESDVIVLSKPRKSFMRGAQYLHAPIPMASKAAPFPIHYELTGSIEGYKHKVYGSNDPRIQVSPEDYAGNHPAWDIREAYDWLWDTYGSYVKPVDISGPDDVQSVVDWAAPDLTISTIPATLLCRDQAHTFASVSVWATEAAHYIPKDTDNHVLCSGDRDHPWYRQSRIQGWENTEYPLDRKPPLGAGKVHEVVKPVKTTCTCFPEIVREGRYGKWTKGVLSHEAFFNTAKRLDDPQGALF